MTAGESVGNRFARMGVLFSSLLCLTEDRRENFSGVHAWDRGGDSRWIAFIYSWIYNVAATAPHNPAIRWALHTTMHNSVTARAEDITAPQRFDEDQVRKGLEHFGETCVECHGAPGVKPSEVGRGLRPEPPDLAEAVKEWAPPQLFWIVKNGVKMTGMPAFGPTHTDEDLWAVVAFLGRLPDMSPEDYRAMAPGAPKAAAEEQQ